MITQCPACHHLKGAIHPTSTSLTYHGIIQKGAVHPRGRGRQRALLGDTEHVLHRVAVREIPEVLVATSGRAAGIFVVHRPGRCFRGIAWLVLQKHVSKRGIEHHGALGFQPLQRELRVPIYKALRGGIHGFDLPALLHKRCGACRISSVRVRASVIPNFVGDAPVKRHEAPARGVRCFQILRRITGLANGAAIELPGRCPLRQWAGWRAVCGGATRLGDHLVPSRGTRTLSNHGEGLNHFRAGVLR